MRKRLPLAAALVLTLGAGLLGLTARRPAAQAAPAARAAANPMADLLSGRLYPTTLKRDALAPAYHFITLLDGQGIPAECATKGDVVQIAGETFLVAYRLFDAPKPTLADAAPAPPDAQLTLINMHYVQAMGGIRDSPTPPSAPAPEAPTPATTATPGTAAP